MAQYNLFCIFKDIIISIAYVRGDDVLDEFEI